MSFEGKVCIVTGASSGIGLAIAVLLAKRNASVVLCGRSEKRLANALHICVGASPGHNQKKFLTISGDVTDATSRNYIIEKTLSVFKKIDVLVCNAGTADVFQAILEMKEQNYDNIMDLNVKSVFFLIQRAVPHLEKTKGNIVSISSALSHDSIPCAAYGVSKAAVDQMMRCCAAQFAPNGIRVNTVNPTFIRGTKILRETLPKGSKEEAMEAATDAFMDTKSKLHPLGRRCGTTEDIAHAVVFLASTEASFITGQNLVVDGGIMVKSHAFPDDN